MSNLRRTLGCQVKRPETGSLDTLDFRLITMLLRNARRSLESLASEVGISNVAVLKRLKHLTDKGIIQYAIYLDFKRVQGYLFSIVALKVKHADRENMVTRLVACPYAYRVMRTRGKFNIVASFCFSRPQEMGDFLTDFYGPLREVQDSAHLFLVNNSLGNKKVAKPRASIDGTDRAIIKAMSKDSRQSASDISRQAGLSTTTVRRHLQQLIDSGLVQPIVTVKPGTPGSVLGYVIIQVRREHLAGVWRKVSRHPAAIHLNALMVGEYSIVANLWGESQEALERITENEFAKQEGVTRCHLLVWEDAVDGKWHDKVIETWLNPPRAQRAVKHSRIQ